MFKVHKKKAPESICDLFCRRAEINQRAYRLRNYNEIDFHLPNRLCYKHLEKLPSYAYIKCFNELPMEIKESETINMFSNSYKELLMQNL